jgi:hypothetical protein
VLFRLAALLALSPAVAAAQDTGRTLKLLASMGLRFNKIPPLQLGYRHVKLEYENSSSGAV